MLPACLEITYVEQVLQEVSAEGPAQYSQQIVGAFMSKI